MKKKKKNLSESKKIMLSREEERGKDDFKWKQKNNVNVEKKKV